MLCLPAQGPIRESSLLKRDCPTLAVATERGQVTWMMTGGRVMSQSPLQGPGCRGTAGSIPKLAFGHDPIIRALPWLAG